MKKKASPIQILRSIIQLISFIFVPALFISIFSSIGYLFSSIINRTFVLTENLGRITLVLGVFLATLLFGRFFCGFICSFGAMQDLLYTIGKLIPFKAKIPEKTDKILKYIKYVVLILIAIVVWGFSLTGDVIWSPWTVFGIYSSPSTWNNIQYLLSLGGLFLLLIIIGSLLIERFFCKYLCPLGAIFSLISRTRLFPIKRQNGKCGNCKLCTSKCTMSIPIYKYDEISSGECINCMKCTEICLNGNMTADTLPAISGTLAVTAIAGLFYAGVISDYSSTNSNNESNNIITTDVEKITYKDGQYTGTGTGFRGNTNVTVTVKNGIISEITVDSFKDDKEFFSQAESVIISSVIRTQSTDVDAVSGATFSSNGLIEAIKNALNNVMPSNATSETTTKQTENKVKQTTSTESEPTTQTVTESVKSTENVNQEKTTLSSTSLYTDGVYTGTGTGFRGATNVTVTVKNGEINDITITSYQDDDNFFNRAQKQIITEILGSQNIDVDAVSGATFSSNGIKEAVANALGIEYTNPNSIAEKGHGRHQH